MKRHILENEQFFRLSRRDFLKLCGTSSVGLLLAACGYPPATATRSRQFTASPIYTSTPFRTKTLAPTSTATPEPTNTLTATRTLTSTPTATIAPTEIAWRTIWSNNGNWRGWTNININGGAINVIPDPTDSGRGEVLKAYVTGPLPTEAGERKRRAQPEKDFNSWRNPQVISAPIAIGADVWYSNELKPLGKKWVNAVSLFSRSKDLTDYRLLRANIYNRRDRYKLGLELAAPGSSSNKGIRLPGAQDFDFEKWHKIEVRILSDGMALLYQDGVLVEYGDLAEAQPDFLLGMFGVRTGMYCGTINPNDDFQQGAYLLKDNHFIAVSP